jgi:hypothetical protein
MRRVLRLFVGVGLCLIVTGTQAWAQATAQINGVVVDGSGLAVPGATVVAIQTDTGFRREAVSDEKGSYALLNLPLGSYRLEAMLQGFRTYAQTGIVLTVNSNPVIRIVLEVGAVEETVTVEGAAPLVETRSPAVGQLMTSAAIEALPLEARNPTALIVLGGASTDNGAGTSRALTSSRQISIAGGQTYGVSYLLDGALHNNFSDGLNLPLPFPDALQEFRVETSSQNASNGMKGAGTVSLVTKSGTNAVHGDGFEFFRHHRFNATDPFAGINERTGKRNNDGLVRNQFGGTFGGPILRDRLFFFGAYQNSLASQTPADALAFVPTPAMLAGDFTEFASARCNTRGNVRLPSPFVNNRIDPALFSRAAVKIAQQLPTTTDPCGAIRFSRPTKPEEKQYISKVDWQLTQNQSLFARYILSTTFYEPSYALTSNVLATNGGSGRDSMSHSLAIGHTMVLSSTTVNNMRFSISRSDAHRTHQTYFEPKDMGINAYSHVPGVMLLNVSGGFSIGGEPDSTYQPHTYTLSDDLTMVRGRHQFAFGGLYSYSSLYLVSNVQSPGSFTFDGGVTGLGLADFMLGNLRDYRLINPYVQNPTQHYVNTYVQDTWTLPRLTVNLGVRWEPWLPQQHQNLAHYAFEADRFRAGIVSKTFPQAPPGFVYSGDPGFYKKAGQPPVYNVILPRVGIAWDPTGEGLTSVRAGYGVNSDTVVGQFFFDSAVPPFGLDVRNTRPAVGPLDDPWAGTGRDNPFPIPFGDAPFLYDATFLASPLDLKNTRVQNWNVGIQHQVGDNMVATATYLGNHLSNVWGVVTGNPGTIPSGASATGPCTLNTVTGPRIFPNCSLAPLGLRREISQADPQIGQQIGFLDYFTDLGWQRYNGLLLSVQRRTGGITTNTNYTYSKCEGLENQGGEPSNAATGYMLPVSILNPPGEEQTKSLLENHKGPCPANRTHILNVSATYEIPAFSSGAVRAVVGGWRLSGVFQASSGAPLSVTTGLDRALTGAPGVQRANQVLDDPYGGKTVDKWLNPAAFAQPALGTFGTSSRGAYLGPGRKNVNLSLVRSFRVQSTHRLEARVEAFNAFNWFNWGNPTTALNSPNFGRILTSGGDARVMQFAMKYSF